ncbi:MAG: Spy/CpxP family protein refolding chaperone [Deltaproteobacteria bacterium]|nr:Spy/CpxP family protein refolding chaperone [Candidatus Zymogenaceae bacterium]
MSRRTLIIILIVSIGINLGLLGFMGFNVVRETRLFNERRPLPHWLRTIEGLTPEQKDRIDTIVTEGRQPMEAHMNDLFQRRCELNLLITRPNPDLAAIDAKITEISGIQAQMEKFIVQQILAVRGVLTPEQQQILIDYMGRCMIPPGPPFGGMGPGSRTERGGHGWGRGGPNR